MLAAALIFTAAGFAARQDKKTNITVKETIEIPGAVLTPGEYVVQLVENTSTNNIVQFTNADETKVIATVVAIPNERLEATGETKFRFWETPAGDPPALRAWFYPGDLNGQEFAYPESRAREIAVHAHRNVPSVPDDVSEKAKKAESDMDPVVIYREIAVVGVSPDEKKSDWKTAAAMNEKADKKMWDSSSYLTAREQTEGRLARQVRHELVTLPYYGVFDNFKFSVDGDKVMLMGKVTRPTLKTSAERVVKQLEGVNQVDNRIEVLPVSPNDNRIRLDVYRSVYSHPMLDRYQLRAVPPIHIIVENGQVSLEGVVATESDKNVAGIQANSVSGVFSVDNNLRVEGTT